MDARHREFEIDGQRYVLRIGNDNQIGFCEVSLSPDSGWYFGVVEYFYNYDDTGNCQNPYRVFRTIAEAVLLWIRKDKPKWFRFWTISHNKADIFRKLV